MSDTNKGKFLVMAVGKDGHTRYASYACPSRCRYRWGDLNAAVRFEDYRDAHNVKRDLAEHSNIRFAVRPTIVDDARDL